MAQNSKDAQKRASRAERRAAEAAEMKARAEQMEKERRQQTLIGAIVMAVLVILALAAFGVAWYLTDDNLAALPQRLKTLRLPEWVTLWQAHEPKPGARLI